jgi:hypothetical protein
VGRYPFVYGTIANEWVTENRKLSVHVIDVDTKRLVLVVHDLSNVLDVLEEVVRQLHVQIELLELDLALSARLILRVSLVLELLLFLL